MKQQKSNEGKLGSTKRPNHHHQILTSSFEGTDNGTFETRRTVGNMMADSSFNTSVTTKMLMPHELGASNNVGTATLVGQHSIHDIHGTSFYHPVVGNTSLTTGFNGFHNATFSNYSHNLNGISTIATANTASPSFSNLVHQQPITLSNNHSITTVTAISSTMPPPLIPYHQTITTTSNINNSISNATNEIQHLRKTSDKAINSSSINHKKTPSESDEEQRQNLPVAALSEDLTTTEESSEIMNNTETNQEDNDEPEIDIVISNVVCAFSVRCHLSLKEIALHGANVEYKRENGMVTMKLRKPYTTASIWSSGMCI